jgi:hypothetical protein
MQETKLKLLKIKTRVKSSILDFLILRLTELIRQKTPVAYNQVQFSATNFEPMLMVV